MKERPETGFDLAETQHLQAFSRLSARQKLDWLQQAKEFCRKYLGIARRSSAEAESPK